MCSATQYGFFLSRSYEEVNEAAARRSATGPGNPYWKRPLGSTGLMGRASFAIGFKTGIGGRAVDEFDTVVVVVVVATGGSGVVLREPYNAAVAAAPAAAPPAATMANVTFDIAWKCPQSEE